MSIYAQFEPSQKQHQIASNQGWTDALNWIESLDKANYASLSELALNGSVTVSTDLINEIESALAKSKPDEATEKVFDLLLEAITENTDDEIVGITNGVQDQKTGGD